MSQSLKKTSYNEVFISYSRKNRDFAKKIVDSIYENGRDNIWVDWEDIEYSEDWWERIQNGINSAHNFLFLLTPDSAKSRVCYDEVDYAVNQGKRIVPILHISLDEENQEQIHPAIAQHHWLAFQEGDDFDIGMQHLIQTIDTDLEHVRTHTRLLTRAEEWRASRRDDSRLLTRGEVQSAIDWLNSSEIAQKVPQPVDIHRDFIDSSQQYYRKQRVQTIGIIVLSAVIFIAILLSQALLSQQTQAEIALQAAATAQAASDANEILAENANTVLSLFLSDNPPPVFLLYDGGSLMMFNGDANNPIDVSNIRFTAYVTNEAGNMIGGADYDWNNFTNTAHEILQPGTCFMLYDSEQYSRPPSDGISGIEYCDTSPFWRTTSRVFWVSDNTEDYFEVLVGVDLLSRCGMVKPNETNAKLCSFIRFDLE